MNKTQSTDLNSGSIVDYRKYVAQYLDENGELEDVQDDLGSHHRAAVNKFRKAPDADFEEISIGLKESNGDTE